MGEDSSCDGSAAEDRLVHGALEGPPEGALLGNGVSGGAGAGAPGKPPALERAGSIHPKDEIRAETTYLELLLLAIPSMLLSGAAPLAVTVQTAMLGQKATELLAAWAVVSATTNSAVVIFNFLVVGVTAKVSLAVGARAWRQVGARIRLALMSALCAGVVAAFLLAALKKPIFALMDTNPAVQKPAEQYYFLRCLGLPSQLLAMAVVGILQGYKRVYLVATINIARLVFEVTTSYCALFYLDWGMWGVGIANIMAVTMAFVAGLILVAILPPKEGKGQIPLLPPEWGGCWQACCSPGKKRPTSSFAFSDTPDPTTRLLAPENQDFDVEKNSASDDEPQVDEHGGTWDFIWDGLSTIMRSALIQITFFLSLVCASRLGMYAVAAHQVIMQLWLITVYVVDGFANAGTIVGSDLAGRMESSRGPQALFILFELRKMTRRLLQMGNCVGLLVAVTYFFGREQIIGAFTYDEGTKAQLRMVWPLLTLVQPLNATVFIYDGLIYASQSFNYMANCMFVGFIVVFLPFCGASAFIFKNLLWIWIAKASFNIVRFAAASYRIHIHWLKPKWAEGKEYPDEWSRHGGINMLPAGWIDRTRSDAASAS